MLSAKLHLGKADPVAPALLAWSGCCMPGASGEESRQRAVPTSSLNAERDEVDLRITRSRSLSFSSGNASLELLASKLSNPTSQLHFALASGAWGFLVFCSGFFLGILFNVLNFEALFLLYLVGHLLLGARRAVCLLLRGRDTFPLLHVTLQHP